MTAGTWVVSRPGPTGPITETQPTEAAAKAREAELRAVRETQFTVAWFCPDASDVPENAQDGRCGSNTRSLALGAVGNLYGRQNGDLEESA